MLWGQQTEKLIQLREGESDLWGGWSYSTPSVVKCAGGQNGPFQGKVGLFGTKTDPPRGGVPAMHRPPRAGNQKPDISSTTKMCNKHDTVRCLPLSSLWHLTQGLGTVSVDWTIWHSLHSPQFVDCVPQFFRTVGKWPPYSQQLNFFSCRGMERVWHRTFLVAR